MTLGASIVAALEALSEDEEIPARARERIALVLGAPHVERIGVRARRDLYLAAADLRLGTGHVADVERAAAVILAHAWPEVADDASPRPELAPGRADGGADGPGGGEDPKGPENANG